jgi:allantoin racemase
MIGAVRILLVNPNTTEAMTEEMAEAARAVALPGTEIEAVTAEHGVATIDGYYDDLLGAAAVAEIVRSHNASFDVAVIACFGDPGLYAARELTNAPVVGIAEAAFMVAMTLGYRFSILTNLERGVPLLEDLVRHYGFSERCTSIRSTELSVADADADRDAAYEVFLPAARQAVHDDRADVLCLACGSLLGLRERLEAELHVPVLEGVPAAIAYAESLVRLGLRTSKRRAFKRPEPNVYA